MCIYVNVVFYFTYVKIQNTTNGTAKIWQIPHFMTYETQDFN